MKTLLIIAAAVVFLAATIGVIIWVGSAGDPLVDNDAAQKDVEERYLTVVNATGQVINSVYVTVGEGTEVTSMSAENIDRTSFSLKIPEGYETYTEFLVTLVDRYDLKYQKTVKDVALQGRTEVKIAEDDYVEEDGDWWDKINKFFNGD